MKSADKAENKPFDLPAPIVSARGMVSAWAMQHLVRAMQRGCYSFSAEFHLEELPHVMEAIVRNIDQTGKVYMITLKPSRMGEFDHWQVSMRLLSTDKEGSWRPAPVYVLKVEKEPGCSLLNIDGMSIAVDPKSRWTILPASLEEPGNKEIFDLFFNNPAVKRAELYVMQEDRWERLKAWNRTEGLR